MDFQPIRREYEMGGLREEEMLANPIEQFKHWFQLALDQSPGKWLEMNAMTLATASRSGKVTSRVVLLKGLHEAGLNFYTNYDSTKGEQLAENPNASLLFFWPHLGRQVRIEGAVSKTSREQSVEYFHSRPRGSQIGAAISNQSRLVTSRDALETKAREFTEQMEGQEIPCPENWGGYLLIPNRFEFWQGRMNRLHDRIVYTVSDDQSWTLQRLSP